MCRRLVVSALAALAVLVLAPVTAGAATWPVRTVATGGPAFHRDVAGLPGGGVATLLERRAGGGSRLELWVGTRRTRIATSTRGHSFDARLAADARGRIVVAWAVVPDAGGGARRAYAWTAARGVQTIAASSRSVTTVELAVTPGGRAAIALPVGGTATYVARGTTQEGFAAPATAVATGDAGYPSHVGIADDGTATVTWRVRGGIALARAAWGVPFGASVVAAVPSPDEVALAVTSAGRAVIGVKSTVRELSGAYARTLSTVVWDPGAAAPAPARVVSSGQAGSPAALAVGDRAFVVWRQARTSRSGPATLAVATVAGDGTQRVRFTIPGRGGAGGPLGTIALARSGTGVRPYFAVGGSTHTTHVDATGRVSGTSVALGPAEGRPYVAAAEAGGRPVVVFTRQLFAGNAGYRIRIARPPVR